MDKNNKSQIVEKLNSQLQDSSALLLCHYHGVSVSEINNLRFKARESGINVSVVKNTLSRLAVNGTEFEVLKDKFQGPTILLYSDDIVGLSKLVTDFSKSNEFFKILSGCFNEELLAAEDVKVFSSLPSLDELRGKLVSLLQTPASRIVSVTKEPGTYLARVFNSYSNKN